MYNAQIQKALAKKYAGENSLEIVKEAFDRRLQKALQVDGDEDAEAFTALTFIDISGFSSRVKGLTSRQVREYLDGYYALVLKAIYSSGGHVDRIAGDGILAAFSSLLTPGLSDDDAGRKALGCAEAVVKVLSDSAWPCKASLASGGLLYCSTGLKDVYEDYTIIGEAITLAYRQEELAERDQVLLPVKSAVGKLVTEALQRWRESGRPGGTTWSVTTERVDLRGIGPTDIYVQRLVSS